MTKIIFILLLFLLGLPTNGQSNNVKNEIGQFKNAASITVNSLGNIYVTDVEENILLQLNKQGEILKSIGGFGWNNSTFDAPVDVVNKIFTLYVVDKNNHRIQLFDRELNFVGIIQSGNEDETSFSYPIAIDVSSQGDVYILDSELSRILKYSTFGNLLYVIGDYDSGNFILESPKDIALLKDTFLLVISQNQLYIFDLFGNGITQIQLPVEANKITTSSNHCFISSGKDIYHFSFNLSEIPVFNKIYEIDSNDNVIQNITIQNNELFVLSTKQIFIININQFLNND